MDPKLEVAVKEWLERDKCEATRAEVEKLVEGKEYETLKMILLSGRLEFGTAGLRAKMGAGYTKMNHLTVLQTAQGFCRYVQAQNPDYFGKEGEKEEAKKENNSSGKPCMIVGYDARHNSKEFAAITANVFSRNGFKVMLFSQAVCTPYVVFAVRHFKNCLCGVTVTASHNPKQDNGYKVCWSNGAHLIPPHDEGIAKEIQKNLEPWPSSWDAIPPSSTSTSTSAGSADDALTIEVVDPFQEIHAHFNSSLHNAITFPNMIKESKLKIVYTAMHGVGTEFVERSLIQELGFPLENFHKVPQQCFPDPEFSTVDFPNPEEGRSALDLSMQLGTSVKADVILANDPDADRLAVAERHPQTGEWQLLTGNQLGALFGWWAIFTFKNKKSQSLAKDGATTDLSHCAMLASTVSSRILQSMAAKEGFYFEETLTGFKWMGTKAYEQTQSPNNRKVLFAFEESIGYMCGDRVWDKDGVTAICVLAEMASWLQSPQGGGELTLVHQLEKIYQLYGYHDSSNSYVISHDVAKTNAMFDTIRKPSYPEVIGGAKVTWIRDLTTGYDSNTPDKKPLLPCTPGANMITMSLDTGITFTIRSSGTEPKLKWYSERVTSEKPVPGELDKFVSEHIVKVLMKPTEYGFHPKPE